MNGGKYGYHTDVSQGKLFFACSLCSGSVTISPGNTSFPPLFQLVGFPLLSSLYPQLSSLGVPQLSSLSVPQLSSLDPHLPRGAMNPFYPPPAAPHSPPSLHSLSLSSPSFVLPPPPPPLSNIFLSPPLTLPAPPTPLPDLCHSPPLTLPAPPPPLSLTGPADTITLHAPPITHQIKINDLKNEEMMKVAFNLILPIKYLEQRITFPSLSTSLLVSLSDISAGQTYYIPQKNIDGNNNQAPREDPMA